MNEFDELMQTSEQKESTELATVASVTSNGVTLILDGNAGEATEKEYKCNQSAVFKPGDRVKVTKHSGTIIVDFPIGAPKASEPIARLTTTSAAFMMQKINEIIDRLNG